MKKNKTHTMIQISLCSALIAICSWITIPLGTIPFTLQTMAVFLTIELLGPKKAFMTIIVYLLVGFVGIPVFSNYNAGPSVLLGPTGGYLLGFLVQPTIYFVVFKFCRWTKFKSIIVQLIGLFTCYLCGTFWFVAVYSSNVQVIGFYSALTLCVIPFIIPDIIKLLVATLLARRIDLVLKINKA